MLNSSTTIKLKKENTLSNKTRYTVWLIIPKNKNKQNTSTICSVDILVSNNDQFTPSIHCTWIASHKMHQDKTSKNNIQFLAVS